MAIASRTTTIKYSEPPKAGKTGASYYPAGEWNVSAVYKYTDTSVPVVWYKGLYYALLDNEATRAGLTGGSTPQEDTNNVNWKVFDDFKYIFTDVAFIEFGKLASAVFSGDFMMSQYGRNAAGTRVETENGYKDFDPSESYPQGNNFRPNILMDMLTGKAFFNEAVVSGNFNVGAMSYKFASPDAANSMDDVGLVFGGGTYNLPNIPTGTSREIKAINPIWDGSQTDLKIVSNSPLQPILVYDRDRGYSVAGYSLTLEANKMYSIQGISGNFFIGDSYKTGIWIVGSNVGGTDAGANIVVDEVLNGDSINPIANKAVYTALNNKIQVITNENDALGKNDGVLYIITG